MPKSASRQLPPQERGRESSSQAGYQYERHAEEHTTGNHHDHEAVRRDEIVKLLGLDVGIAGLRVPHDLDHFVPELVLRMGGQRENHCQRDEDCRAERSAKRSKPKTGARGRFVPQTAPAVQPNAEIPRHRHRHDETKWKQTQHGGNRSGVQRGTHCRLAI